MQWLADAREKAAPRIDWWETSGQGLDAVRLHVPRHNLVALRVPPPPDYTQSWKDATGARLDLNDRTELWRFTLPGLASASRSTPTLLELPGVPVRIDIAIDTAGPCTPEWLLAALDERRFCGRWHTARLVHEWDPHDPPTRDHGRTVYLGRRGKASLLRVYDRQAKLGSGEPCTRWELELRGHAALVAKRDIAEHGKLLLTFERLLANKLRITKDPVDPHHTDRAEIDSDFASLFSSSSKLLTTPPDGDPRSATGRRVRALRHLSRALALVHHHAGAPGVRHLVEDGYARATAQDAFAKMSDEHQSQVERELEKCLNSEEILTDEPRVAETPAAGKGEDLQCASPASSPCPF